MIVMFSNFYLYYTSHMMKLCCQTPAHNSWSCFFWFCIIWNFIHHYLIFYINSTMKNVRFYPIPQYWMLCSSTSSAFFVPSQLFLLCQKESRLAILILAHDQWFHSFIAIWAWCPTISISYMDGIEQHITRIWMQN